MMNLQEIKISIFQLCDNDIYRLRKLWRMLLPFTEKRKIFPDILRHTLIEFGLEIVLISSVKKLWVC